MTRQQCCSGRRYPREYLPLFATSSPSTHLVRITPDITVYASPCTSSRESALPLHKKKSHRFHQRNHQGEPVIAQPKTQLATPRVGGQGRRRASGPCLARKYLFDDRRLEQEQVPIRLSRHRSPPCTTCCFRLTCMRWRGRIPCGSPSSGLCLLAVWALPPQQGLRGRLSCQLDGQCLP